MKQQKIDFVTDSPLPKRKKGMDKKALIILISFIVVGGILAVVGGKFVFSLVKGWSLTSLPGAPVASENTTTTDNTQPSTTIQNNTGPATPAWDGKSRINILLMGLDYSVKRQQTQDQGSPLSDTMILVTVDPLTKTMGVMSILRDLWVNIPGYDYNKINSAYKLGEDFQVPGGGPQLAMDTVEQLLGVPVDFYARVDFKAFKTIVDELGGVEITLQQRMLLDWKGNGNKFWIEPGTYVLPGSYALAYARTRDADYGEGDVSRSSRQMEVIMALRDRMINNLPGLVSKAPALYNEISSSVHTNMTLDQAIQLAYTVAQIPRDSMHLYSMSYNEAEPQQTPDGIYVLRVIPEQMRILRDKVFTNSGVAAAPVITGNSSGSVQLAASEGARIEIYNGSNVSGLAEATSSYLVGQGLNITSTGNTDLTPNTKIIYHSDTPYAIKYLSDLMQVTSGNITNNNDPNSSADVTVILGNDWAASNPLP